MAAPSPALAQAATALLVHAVGVWQPPQTVQAVASPVVESEVATPAPAPESPFPLPAEVEATLSASSAAGAISLAGIALS